MTKEELAKAYHERIIERNPQAEAWNFSGAFIDGYNVGYDAAMNKFAAMNRFDDDITPREKAKAYCQPILKDNHNKTYGFELYDIEDGFMAGYADGFADASEIERIPSDDMLRKIINECWMKMATNSINGTDDMLKYIKEYLYNEQKRTNIRYCRTLLSE